MSRPQYDQLLQQQRQRPVRQQPGYQNKDGLSINQISHVSEAWASPILPGMTKVFINRPSGEIYVSQLNNIGRKEIGLYKFMEIVPAPQTMDSRAEIMALKNEISELKSMVSNILRQGVRTMNPMQVAQALQKGLSPEQIISQQVQSLRQQAMTSPRARQTLSMIEGKGPEEIIVTARNMYESNGQNYDDYVSQAKQQFGF